MDNVQWMAAVVVAFLAAAIPTFLYVLLIRWLDRYEKEPAWLLAAAFLWGAMPAVIISLIFEFILGLPWQLAGGSLLTGFVEASLIAPIVEEVVKALALWGLLVIFRAEFDDVLDGVIYGALIGFGFAMTEHFFYLLGSFGEGGFSSLITTAVLRVGIFGFTHAVFTAITGAGFGYARNAPSRNAGRLMIFVALAGAMAFHAVHNFGATLVQAFPGALILSLANNAAGFLLVGLIILLALSQEKRWIAEELRDEIGVSLSEEGYAVLIRRRAGAARRMGKLACMAGIRVSKLAELRRLATELAFKKAQHRAGDRSPKLEESIARLRQEIITLQDTFACPTDLE
ncbi:MAG: PrsW family intramembrane metalloprotease [Anaerolineae bacterium]